MPVRLFYVDESYDDTKYCLSALSIRHADWKACFEAVKQYRANLKADYGVYLRKEIHARDLVKGRGKLAPAPIGKWQRSRIFFGLLQLVAALPHNPPFASIYEANAISAPKSTCAHTVLPCAFWTTLLTFNHDNSGHQPTYIWQRESIRSVDGSVVIERW